MAMATLPKRAGSVSAKSVVAIIALAKVARARSMAM